MTQKKDPFIKQRKTDHVELCVSGDVSYQKTTGLEKFHFIHNALPEINFDDISTEAQMAGRTFAFPLFISSMTGGYAGAEAVNAVIARFCEKYNLPFGVGSQRAMLEAPETGKTFSVAREMAPNAFIAANLGGCQLAAPFDKAKIRKLVDCIQADAFIVHLNPLQELMQPEGDRDFKGVLDGISRLCDILSIPVIVKETGAGISAKVAAKLVNAGVSIIDVSGAGGTSWSKVENVRSGAACAGFDDWGIPLVDCLTEIESSDELNVEIIASGGIRNGFDITKSLCLGADFTAMAQPVIKAVIDDGENGLESWFAKLQKEIKTIMCLLGAGTISELHKNQIRAV